MAGVATEALSAQRSLAKDALKEVVNKARKFLEAAELLEVALLRNHWTFS